jgi:DDE superfamily endonuclease
MVGISKTEVGDSLDLLLGKLAALGFCQPDGTSITTLAELEQRLGEMTEVGEAVCVDGLAIRVQRPHEWGNQKALYDAKRHAHTAQGVALSSVHVTCCGWMGLARKLPRARALGLSGLDGVLDAAGVAVILDRGFRGMATLREHWHTPVGDRRTKDRLGEGQRAFNRVQAGLRALVEQAIAHLASAWALRRWRGLLYRIRAVFRAAGALICLGRWLHRIPTQTSTPDTLA